MSEIEIIANKIKNAGGRLYLVGGAVRDEILGKEIHDEDYCVTGIKDFQKLFPETYVRGKDFAVFDINGKEFAMARDVLTPHHYGHGNTGPDVIEKFGRNLKIPNNWIKCDKTSGGRDNNIENINFEKIGKQCINEINGEYIQNKYNIKPGIELGKKLHEERIKWLKEKLK